MVTARGPRGTATQPAGRLGTPANRWENQIANQNAGDLNELVPSTRALRQRSHALLNALPERLTIPTASRAMAIHICGAKTAG
eukprot:11192394-Lingulodinium_polyedra.AAC.1